MHAFHELVLTSIRRQFGVVARWQTRRAGVPDWVVDNLVRAGVLLPVHRAVYRHAAFPFTQELRWTAAVLAAGSDAVLSHRAAGALHDFDVRRARAEVTSPYSRLPIVPGVDLHRSRRLTPGDIVRVRGIPATSRPRTVLDLAGIMPYAVFAPMLEDAVARNLVGVESLLAIVDRKGGRGVTGTVALRTGLERGLVDDAIESKLELLVARIVASADVPPPVRQHEMRCVDGRDVRLDNAWPDLRVAVEADGRRWHASSAHARRTRERSRSITASGWQHYVYGWAEATETPLDVRRELELVIQPLLLAA